MMQIRSACIIILILGLLCILPSEITLADCFQSHYSDYDSVEPYIHGYACVGKNGLFGLVNEECDVVVPIEYICVITFDSATVYTDYGYCEVADEDGTGVYTITESKLLIPCKYDAVFYEETETGAYFIGQKYPLENRNDGWWELYDFDIYDADGNLQYQTKAYYVRFSNDYPGFIEERIESEGTWLGESRFIEIQPNTGNKRKHFQEDAKEYVYTNEKEQVLINAYDELFIYYPDTYYIVVKDGVCSFVDIDGNELEKTKINNFEYEWEAIRINGKVYSGYMW